MRTTIQSSPLSMPPRLYLSALVVISLSDPLSDVKIIAVLSRFVDAPSPGLTLLYNYDYRPTCIPKKLHVPLDYWFELSDQM